MLTYFSANPNGEAEIITINLRQVGSVKKLKWDLEFADVLVKGRASKGNLVTKYAVKRIELKSKGVSTLMPRKIWFDDTIQRINIDGRGELLGEFKGDDKLLIISQSGTVKTVIPEVTLHFDDQMIVLEKWIPNKPISAIYFDGEKKRYYIKRFLVEHEGKEESFISEHPKTQLEIVALDYRPVVEIIYSKQRGKDKKDNQEINIEEFIAIKGIKALGNQLTTEKIKQINLLTSLPFEVSEAEELNEIEVIEKNVINDTNRIDLDNTTLGADGEQTELF
jgi:topoisomerase-4 subunit A